MWYNILCGLPMASGILTAMPEPAEFKRILKEAPPVIVELKKEIDALRTEQGASRFTMELIRRLEKERRTAELTYEDRQEALMSLLTKVRKSGDINATDSDGRTLLMLAAATGHNAATELVLKYSPLLNMADADELTACDYEQLNKGTALQHKLKENWAQAVNTGDTDAVQELLNCGADPNWEVQNKAPIALAIQQQNTALFELLVTYGASVETRLENGIKLIEYAVITLNADILELLLRHGCSPETRLSDGRPMFEHLLSENAGECLLTWLSYMKEEQPVYLCKLVRLGSPQAIQTVFNAHKSDINTEDQNGNIPLHEAARRGDCGIYQILVSLGADTMARNMRQETTLMHAALSGNTNMLDTVLKAMPQEEIQARDESGHTALHYAQLARDKKAQQTLTAAGLTQN